MDLPDLQEQAASRIAGALVGKPKFAADVAARARMFEDVLAALQQLYTLWDIDASEGVQLDRIGRLVGQSRRIDHAVPRWFFGWDDEAHALPFGEEDDPSVGGVWWDEGTPTSDSALIDDVTYRRCIRMRIAYNLARTDQGVPMTEHLYTVLRLIFPDWTLGAYELAVFDDGGMALRCYVGVQPDDLQTALLKYARVLPINMGVNLTILVGGTFGFDDTPGDDVLGFDEEGAPGSGGVWAEEL